MSALKLRNKALLICGEICNLMDQPIELKREKFKAILRQTEKEIGEENIPFIAPLEFYRKVYNKALYQKRKIKERLNK